MCPPERTKVMQMAIAPPGVKALLQLVSAIIYYFIYYEAIISTIYRVQYKHLQRACFGHGWDARRQSFSMLTFRGKESNNASDAGGDLWETVLCCVVLYGTRSHSMYQTSQAEP